MCMISEVTIDSRTTEQLAMSKADCASHPLDEDAVPSVVPMSEDEDGSDSDEGYSSMSDDDDLSDSDIEEDTDNNNSEEVLSKINEPKQSANYHELYLPSNVAAYTQPIVFSGGMDADECEEYYRSLEEAAEAAARRDAAAAAAAHAAAGRKRSPLFRRVMHMQRRDSKKMKSNEEDDSSVASTASYHSAASSSSSGSRSSVSFSESVTVHPVHHVDIFPDDVWDSTYTPRRLVKEGKRRAKMEFRYDGCDWRTATEEDGMFHDPRTGRLEHPVHYYDDLDCRTGGGDEVVQMCLIMPGRR